MRKRIIESDIQKYREIEKIVNAKDFTISSKLYLIAKIVIRKYVWLDIPNE